VPLAEAADRSLRRCEPWMAERLGRPDRWRCFSEPEVLVLRDLADTSHQAT
jgi:hypothetical protein